MSVVVEPELTFVCFKWKRITTGVQLPNVIDYSARHVNTLRNMLERHVRIPHRLVCVTDQADYIDSRIEVIPLWDHCRYLGGCYNRLWVFSEEAREYFGDRFCCIDLDCVLVNDCTSIFDRSEDFVINSYNPMIYNEYSPRFKGIDQHYNGGLFMMNAGCRASVWGEFDYETVPPLMIEDQRVVGSDQAWIRYHLGKREARWGNAEGVFEARQVGRHLPPEAKLVMFAGKRDPSTYPFPWVREHWR